MRKHPSTRLAALGLLLVTGTAAYSQSAYFQAMTNLNPAVYFPLQETTPPPLGDIETNYGSLGAVGNAVYGSVNIAKGAGGATADTDSAVSLNNGAGGFLAVPIADAHTAVQTPTFTVEAWVNPAVNNRNFEGIVAKSGGNGAGINAANNQCGFCLSENYIAYLDNANLIGFDFHVFNGVGHGGAEAIVPFNVQASTWYHVVGVYDGTNCWIYINGTNEITAGAGYQISMTGSYVPDTWNPLQLGSSRNLNGNNYQGLLDEVAIYTNVLSPARILSHYNAASSAAPYSTTILADNPYMYWRMDAPTYTAPDPSTYPAATDYGVNGSTYLGSYGTASQPGVPGPQFTGLLDPNNGNASYGVQINGLGGNNGNTANVPIGYNNSFSPIAIADAVPFIIQPDLISDPNALLLNRTNHQPYSVTIWFEGGPYDWSRFATIMGHSDANWRLAMANGGNAGHLQFAPGIGNSGAVVTRRPYDDGQWHQFVGTYDGSNILVYVDGELENFTSNTGNLTSSTLNIILGGDPQYVSGGNAVPSGSAPGITTGYVQRNYHGAISQFAFFTNTLTANQVAYLYTNAVPGPVPPSITAQPASGRVNPAPAFLFFGVVGGGAPPLAYQWYFNTSSNYSGATQLVNDGVKYALVDTTQMTVSNLAPADSGYYFCVISNNYGSVTTILATLAVNYAPIITAQNPAANFSLFPNQTFTLSVSTTSDTNSILYQWYTNGVGDGTKTGSSYPITASAALAGVSYQCIASNIYGAATSAPVTLTVSPFPAALTNSPFGSNVLAFSPTSYWPMHESGEAPAAAEVETNYGSLGQAGLGYYDDWRTTVSGVVGGNLVSGGLTTNLFVLHNFPGAIAGDPNPAVELSGANRSYIVVPRTTPGMTLTPPFTLEAWYKPLNNRSFGIMVGEDNGTLNTSTARGGFDWLYSGSANTFSITVYNGNGGGSTEPKTTANYPPGYWYHVVTTFDGTNIAYYINGVQDSLQNSSAATLNPNTWDPITIGCGRGYGNLVQGVLDEVAVYTNLLAVNDITNHYYAGTNGLGNYKNLVVADNPLLYYRMDSPAYAVPPFSQWPVLTNYGSLGLNGVYTPGAVPGGAAGPAVGGVAAAGLAANTALALNGASTFADALSNAKYNPNGKSPFTVAAWMKGNPADISRNWQAMLGHSDWGWRMNLDGGNGYANFNIGNGAAGGADLGNSSATFQVNDGGWHYVAGTFDGTNTIVWVDGLNAASSSNTGINLTNTANIEVFLGAYPNTAAYANTGTSLANETGRVLAGSLCEAAFWNVALTPNQIQAIYTAAGVAPLIDKQPASAGVNQNSAFTNDTVFAGGSAPLAYQWYENGVARSGLTNAYLNLTAVQLTDASTNWLVVVTNSYGAVTSAPVSVTVFSVPSIAVDVSPTNLTLYAGGHTTFSIVADGAVPLHYQWYSNNVAVANATNPSYALVNAQPANSTQNYNCVVTNTAGTAPSSTVVLSVIPVPSVIPYSQIVVADSPFGFWPLDETNLPSGNADGVIAKDDVAGNNGIYTNAYAGLPGFNPTLDSNRTSVQFGSLATVNSEVYGISTSVDFSATNASSNFSVECWAEGLQAQVSGAGVLNKGYGGGGEQFNLDCGAAASAYRFFVRDASGATHLVNSSVNPSDTVWHHLAGVCNETNGWVIFYIDGQPIGSNSITPGSGILASTRNMLIGARTSNSATNVNDLQYVGYIQDVAVYNYALSATQVLNHFNGGDIPASVLVNPTNVTCGEFGTATFTAAALGTPPLGYQWYDAVTLLPIPGATNLNFVTNKVPFSSSGAQYYLQVTNYFGTNISTAASLTVDQGLAQIIVDVPAQIFTEAGRSFSILVTAYGTMPTTNYWQISDTNAVNWTNLSDTTRITGSSSNVLSVVNANKNDAGSYHLILANSYGSVTSSVAIVTVGTLPVNFNGTGVGWSENQSGTFSAPFFQLPGELELTDNGGSEARSCFFPFPQYIGAFQAFFTYQAGGNKGADGIAFVLQNDTRGAAALGGGGGSLGVSGITPSWELELNIYSGNGDGIGCGIFVNGAVGVNPLGLNVGVGSGDPIDFTLNYWNGRLALTMTDELNTNLTYSTNIVGDLPSQAGGSAAYVGFTGATGGSSAVQTITNFTFISIPTETLQLTASNTVAVTWPGAITGYALQQNDSLSNPNHWSNVTNLNSVVSGVNQVNLPVTSSNLFYRLILQP